MFQEQKIQCEASFTKRKRWNMLLEDKKNGNVSERKNPHKTNFIKLKQKCKKFHEEKINI